MIEKIQSQNKLPSLYGPKKDTIKVTLLRNTKKYHKLSKYQKNPNKY